MILNKQPKETNTVEYTGGRVLKRQGSPRGSPAQSDQKRYREWSISHEETVSNLGLFGWGKDN